MASEKQNSKITRVLDSEGLRHIIKVNDIYEKNILTKVELEIMGTGEKSHRMSSEVYDFKELTRTTEVSDISLEKPKIYPVKNFSSEQEMKAAILKKYNKSKKFRLVCHKEGCTDENCRPILSIGNKRYDPIKGKAPYFRTSCNATEYNEGPEHLEAKFGVYRALFKYKQYSLETNNKTQLESLTVEKTFTSGLGQERRADVYYEKHFYDGQNNLKVQKYAVEVQRSNASYDDLNERTQWYKDNNIAVIWVVVAPIFNKEAVESLSKKDFTLPLLSLISHSMDLYKNRFFIFDNSEGKFLSLTVNFPTEGNFNEFDETNKNQVKRKLNTNDLYIIGNKLNDKGLVNILPYKENRNSKDIYSTISQFGVLGDNISVKDGIWNGSSYIFKEFKKMVSTASIHSHQVNNQLTAQKHIAQVKSLMDISKAMDVDSSLKKPIAYEHMKAMISCVQEKYRNSPNRRFPPLGK